MVEKIHAMERKMRIPDEPGLPGYWQTVCGIRLGGDAPNVTTSDDKKAVTCPKCLNPKKN